MQRTINAELCATRAGFDPASFDPPVFDPASFDPSERGALHDPAGRRAAPFLPHATAALLLAADAAAFGAAFQCVRMLAGSAAAPHDLLHPTARWQLGLTALLFAAVLLACHLRRHYTGRTPLAREAGQLTAIAAAAIAALYLLKAAFDGAPPPAWMALHWAMFVPLALFLRLTVTAWLEQQPGWAIRTLLIGDPAAARDVRAAMESESRRGYRVVQVAAPDALAAAIAAQGPAAAFRATGADLAVVILAGADPAAERRLLHALDRGCLPYAVVPSLQALPVRNVAPGYFYGHDVMMLHPADNFASPFARVGKGLFDLAVALALLAALAPLMLVLLWLIRRDGGPGLFAHRRVGLHGQPFGCLKFRTMVTDADRRLADLLATDPEAAAEWATTQKLRRDPRITAIGRFLRTTSLDELPQLWNVLRGEMSLVGPRPIVHAELARYDADAAYYCKARPGLTGLWQVSGRSETTYDRRVRLDVWYVRNWSFWHDVGILLKTVPAVLSRRGSA